MKKMLLVLRDQELTASGDVIVRMVAVLERHVRFHVVGSPEVVIGNSELRGLPPELRAQNIGHATTVQRPMLFLWHKES
ncbi:MULTISPECIES: hypothetical protein [unclassified Arthrobacter]|uniref:hypothetical protein n=1 Tax=unclassified Arthrobacter TaxID=235627 RepID=UPI001E4AAD47|nr:hypothetical protein [Arthrobacter sp. Bi26]